MKNEPEYITHIKERWNFSLTAAKEHLNLANHTATSIAAIIFEKCCSPYHYFVADSMEADSVEVEEPPTQKQLAYAKKLGINNPENYSKKLLSSKIDEAVK